MRKAEKRKGPLEKGPAHTIASMTSRKFILA